MPTLTLSVQPNMSLDTADTLADDLLAPRTIDDATADLLFREARTVKVFADAPVTDEQVHAAYELAKWGPTALNTSPLRYLVVRTREARERLVQHLAEGNRPGVLAAPLTLVLAADTEFHTLLPRLAPHAAAIADGLAGQPDAREAMARMNATLQAGYLLTALRATGLHVGPMGIADAAGLDADLLAGTGWKSLFIVNLGQPAAEGASYPRAERLSPTEVSTTV